MVFLAAVAERSDVEFRQISGGIAMRVDHCPQHDMVLGAQILCGSFLS